MEDHYKLTRLEEIVDNVVEILRGMVEDKEYFPDGSCIGVSAFIVPFMRLATQQICQVAVGTYEGKTHAWIVCLEGMDTIIVDTTVRQFDKKAPKIVKCDSDAASKYVVGKILDRNEESNLRDYSEPDRMGLATRDGKYLLHQGSGAAKANA